MSLSTAQARKAANKRWKARPFRTCEVCGKEHRCYRIEAEDIEEAVKTLTDLFARSVRGIIVFKGPKQEGANHG